MNKGKTITRQLYDLRMAANDRRPAIAVSLGRQSAKLNLFLRLQITAALWLRHAFSVKGAFAGLACMSLGLLWLGTANNDAVETRYSQVAAESTSCVLTTPIANTLPVQHSSYRTSPV